MNKTELIAAMAKKSGMTKNDAAKALDAYVDTVKEELAANGNITMVGFGTFNVVERAERRAHNPRNGEVITVAAKRVVKFHPAKSILL